MQEITLKNTSSEIVARIKALRENIILKCKEIESLKSSFLNEEFVAAFKISLVGIYVQIQLQKSMESHERTGILQKKKLKNFVMR